MAGANKFQMKPKIILLTTLRRIITLLLAIIALLSIAIFIGGTVPANGNWQEAEQTSLQAVDIFVETNGIHVSIILPTSNDNGILSDKLQAHHMENPAYHSQFAMIGWGHKGVYQNAQDWNDLTVSDAASAAFGTGDSLLHIYYRQNPKPNSYRKKIRITQKQYEHILNNIASYFQYDSNGKLRVYKGYGDDNIFYEAKGRYSMLNTCNTWAGRILREAGIKIGYWTPLSQSIMLRF